MVESEAKELPEDVMLGAVMFGHRHFQPVIEAIIKLAEKAAKEPRDLTVVDNKDLEKEILGLAEQDLRAAYAILEEAGPLRCGRRRQREGDGALLPGRRRAEIRQAARRRRVQGTRSARSFAGTSSTPASASTAAISRPCVRSTCRSACCRAPTARRCSPAARPRRWS